MLFWEALFLANLPKIIADPPASDVTGDLAGNPDLTTIPDWVAPPPADSGFFGTADTKSSGSSDSETEIPDPFSPGVQNGFNIGSIPSSIPAVNTDISISECSSETAQTLNMLQTRSQCSPTDDSIARDAQAREDAKDAAFAKAFLKAHPTYRVDEDAEWICKHWPKWRPLPLCCRGRTIITPSRIGDTMVVEECVMYIEGRPRCIDYRRRFCCWLLGFAYKSYDEGIDCVYMYAHVE